MPTPLKTNQLDISLNHSEIDKAFDIFTVQTTMKYFKSGAFILDAPILEKNVLAVRFETGRMFHVLMKKNIENKQLLRKILNEVQDGDTIILIHTRSNELDDFILTQLLLNSLGSVDHPLLRFNNLTGHLYCFHSEWVKRNQKDDLVWQVPCVEISITKECRMRFDVRTFTSVKLRNRITFGKRKFEDYPQYVFSVRNTLRRKMPEDKVKAFIQRQIDGEKTGNIDFLHIGSFEQFEKSKMGVVSNIVQRFNEQFAGLANINFREITDYASVEYNNCVKKENAALIQSVLQSANVRIVDGISDEYSHKFCQSLQTLLQEKYKISASVGKRISKNCLNLYLIHNAAYYLDGDDPHHKEYPGVAIQHITFEDFAGNVKYALSTVVHELLIKADLAEGKINLFNWEELGFTDTISFGIATEDENAPRYFFMNIHPDGCFTITEQELSLFEQDAYRDCVEVFEQSRDNSEVIKGVIRNSNGQINSIIDTGWCTIPEIMTLRDELKAKNTSLRGKEMREELLNSIIDIRQFEQDGKTYYFVGTIGYGMKYNIHTATCIRRIEPFREAPVFFQKLLPLMNVSFVRNQQLTVIPFPFKYLNEYIRLLKCRS